MPALRSMSESSFIVAVNAIMLKRLRLPTAADTRPTESAATPAAAPAH